MTLAQFVIGGLMNRSRSALVVAATPSLAAQVSAWLKPAGWLVSTAQSYATAKSRLEQGPDLLITELELGDYNGLQLALRAQGSHVAALVIGRQDAVLERDAEQLGSIYIRKEELDEHRLMVAVDAKLAALKYLIPAACSNVEFARRPWLGRLSAPRRFVLN
jgi:CheY-like chemotaxis protein